MELVRFKNTPADFNLRYYKNIILKALKSNTICYFWFHPSIEREFYKNILEPLFEFIHESSDKLFITTSGNYINWLNKQFIPDE